MVVKAQDGEYLAVVVMAVVVVARGCNGGQEGGPSAGR